MTSKPFLIVDENLPPKLAQWFRGAGFEAVHVFDIGLGTTDDGEIWEFAKQNRGTIVTKDQRIVRRHVTSPGPSVILVCIGNATNKVLVEKFSKSLPGLFNYLDSGTQVVELR